MRQKSAATVPVKPRPHAQEYVQQVREHFQAQGIHDEDGVADMEVVVALMRLSTRLAADFETVHRPLGTTWAGFRVLTVLSVTGDLEPSEIARLSFASRASISSVITTLETSGFVVRRRDAKDRRFVTVSLTPAGEVALKQHTLLHAHRERAWMKILSAQERAELHRIVQRLADQPTPKPSE